MYDYIHRSQCVPEYPRIEIPGKVVVFYQTLYTIQDIAQPKVTTATTLHHYHPPQCSEKLFWTWSMNGVEMVIENCTYSM